MRRTAKNAIFVVCLGLVSGGAISSVSAQDVSKVQVDRSVDEQTQEEALKRAEERAKVLDQDRTDAEAGAATGPTMDQQAFEDSQQTMTPEQIDQLKRKLEEKNRSMIKKLTTIIERDPYNDQKPSWMFQKAELMWELRNWEYLRERAKYNQCLDAAMKGTVDEASCETPTADYGEAQEIYKEILQESPGYERLDEVIFRLGRGLLEADENQEAVKYLTRLVNNYPNSRYLPDTRLALGEYFFDAGLLGAAEDNYSAVLNHKGSNLYDYALYKLGWVKFNQGDFRDSVNTFKQVVERTDEKLGFQNQAINDLTVAYAEIDDGWKELRAYLMKQKDNDFTFKQLERMAGLYEAQGKDDAAISVYEFFIKERPDAAKLPSWADSILVAKKKDETDVEGLEREMNRFVAYFDPSGTWWAKNKDNERSTNNALLLVDASLSFLSNYYHRQAQANDNLDFYKKAAKYYQQYIERFPETAASFDMNFFLAEILLLNMNQPEEAAQRYQKVVELYKNDNVPEGVKEKDALAIAKDSAYAVVSAYNELVKNNHQDSILVEMAKYDESKRAAQATDQRPESIEEKPIPKTPLLKYEEGFVSASDQYSEMFPKEDVTPTVDFVAAEVYKSRGHYESAIPRYESIIQNAPKHRYASFAGNSLLEANYRLNRWDEVEQWARYLMDNKIFDVTPKDKLESAIAFAINERAKELRDDKQFEKASDELLRLAKEFPKSELAPGAIFNAAAIYESGDQVNDALKTYNRVVEEYPKSLQAPEAIFVMGAIYESRADLAEAATQFSRLGSDAAYVNAEGEEVKYKDHEKAADAVYNAAVLEEAMENWEKSIGTYEKYMDLYPDRENVREIRLHLAYLEKERDDWKSAQKRFEEFLSRSDVEPKEKVELHNQIGLMIAKIKDNRWESRSDEHFTNSLSEWKELSEEDKNATKYFAAESRFLQGERVFEEFSSVNLVYERLAKTLERKGELEQKAEGIYTEVIQMASPRWVAASAFRIGQMYKNFSDELYNQPTPEGLTPEQEEMYRMQLDEYAFPLQEKALTAYRSALELALQYRAYNEWSSRSAAAISQLESEAYPITGQDGVNVEHEQLNFYIPKPISDIDVVIERAKARKAAREAAQPDPAPEAPTESEEATEGPQASL